MLIATSGTVTTTVPTVTLNTASASVGAAVIATVANGPGTPGDWVGLYDAATGNNVTWRYLNGTQVKPTVGQPSASVTFTLPATPGSFYVKLFNATYVLVATSGAVSSTLPTVTLGATTATAGGTVTAAIANGPGTAGDWVGLYDANGNNIAWRYLNGTQTLPTIGLTNATVTFPLPATPGTFHARFFNAQYTLIATSGTVTTTLPTVTLNTSSASVGGTVTATVANGPSTAGDWVGLYDAATDNNVAWRYLNGTQVKPTVGIASASITFTLPGTPGTYYVKLFNASYILVATSGTVTSTVPTVTLSATTASIGGSVIAAVANGPGTAGD